ncbi:MAG TPA: site-specific integrase [Solirubrobacteraceae bacterium]|nr:site-specific integrase [Solirubrobacteraceae bacterium]
MGQPPANKGKRYPAEPLTRAEFHRLLGVCGRGPAGLRNRALLVLLYRTGVRISEALALYPKDIDLRTGSATVLEGKRRKRRTVGGIDPQAAAIIEQWLAERSRRGINGRHPLFCTITRDLASGESGPGRPVRAAYYRELCKRLGKKAGIDKRVHPHGLRHTCAFDMAEEGIPMHMIQAQLGHESLSTTGQYIGHINPAALVEAMRNRSWVSDAEHGPSS